MLSFFSNVYAAKVYDRNFGRDLKLPTQKLLEKITISAPDVASTSYVIIATNGRVSATAVTLTTGFTQPDVPRALIITPAGTTADVKAGNVTITGTDIYGTSISENFAFLENATAATTGTKSFKTITSIAFPAEDSPYGAQWTIGITDKLGLDKCIDVAGDVAWASFGGAFETTHPTCVADVDEVEKNVCDLNSASNASSDAIIYFIQNFRCAQ